jgi:hypothetical protein
MPVLWLRWAPRDAKLVLAGTKVLYASILDGLFLHRFVIRRAMDEAVMFRVTDRRTETGLGTTVAPP